MGASARSQSRVQVLPNHSCWAKATRRRAFEVGRSRAGDRASDATGRRDMRLVLRRVLNAIRHPSDAEIARELRDHLELEAEAIGGSDPSGASYRARRRFGNATSAAETVREVWRLASLDQLGQDLRQG